MRAHGISNVKTHCTYITETFMTIGTLEMSILQRGREPNGWGCSPALGYPMNILQCRAWLWGVSKRSHGRHIFPIHLTVRACDAIICKVRVHVRTHFLRAFLIQKFRINLFNSWRLIFSSHDHDDTSFSLSRVMTSARWYFQGVCERWR